jgi:hypothetical protein
VIDENTFAASDPELGGLRVRVLLPLRNSGVADLMCHAENVTAEVSLRIGFGGGFGRGFRRIGPRRVTQLLVDVTSLP